MQNKKILVIDDSDDHRELLRQLFTDEGYSVVSAAHGLEALKLLRSSADLPAFILLDVMMPVMDGYEFREQQSRDPDLTNIPVIIMTADGHAAAKCQKMKARGHIGKPVNIDDLLTIAEQYCT